MSMQSVPSAPLKIRTAPASSKKKLPPPLFSGDRLSRAEFERRYIAHPEIKQAELIEGVVYIMPSPIHFNFHARPHGWFIAWVANYCAATPGVNLGDNATLRLDYENEVQPDVLLRLESGVGGRSKVTEDDYLEGPPELIIEIAASSASYDLHDKRRVYARNGIPEYIVTQMYDQHFDWFILRAGIYENLQPGPDGIYRSEIFPGLWLRAEDFWTGNLTGMVATLQQGLVSKEHNEYKKTLSPQT